MASWTDPWRDIAHLQREMNRLWDSLSGDRETFRGAGVYPALNVTEDDDNVYVRAEMPGVSAGDLEISAQGDSLVITGERKIPEEKNVVYHRREREAGTFKRITSLPTHIDSSKVKATLRDGVLTVTMPKAAEAKPTKIAVKAS
jgi:HSP20 family protein